MFWEQLNEYEEAKRMPYITSVERIGMERGMEVSRLEELMDIAVQAESLATFAQALELVAPA